MGHHHTEGGPYTYEEALKLADCLNESQAYERLQCVASRCC